MTQTLVNEVVVVHPGVDTLQHAVDKAHMRAVLDRAGIAMPAHIVVDLATEGTGPMDEFGLTHGWPIVLKTARGGYDGKGIWMVGALSEAESVLAHLSGQVLVEKMVPLKAELAGGGDGPVGRGVS